MKLESRRAWLFYYSCLQVASFLHCVSKSSHL